MNKLIAVIAAASCLTSYIVGRHVDGPRTFGAHIGFVALAAYLFALTVVAALRSSRPNMGVQLFPGHIAISVLSGMAAYACFSPKNELLLLTALPGLLAGVLCVNSTFLATLGLLGLKAPATPSQAAPH